MALSRINFPNIPKPQALFLYNITEWTVITLTTFQYSISFSFTLAMALNIILFCNGLIITVASIQHG